MDWLLLAGLVLGGLIFVGVMMMLLRFERIPGRMPPWFTLGLMLVSAAFLVVSVVAGSWLNVLSFALNVLVWGMLFASARRAGQA